MTKLMDLEKIDKSLRFHIDGAESDGYLRLVIHKDTFEQLLDTAVQAHKLADENAKLRSWLADAVTVIDDLGHYPIFVRATRDYLDTHNDDEVGSGR